MQKSNENYSYSQQTKHPHGKKIKRSKTKTIAENKKNAQKSYYFQNNSLIFDDFLFCF